MQTTGNLGLKKPEGTDIVDIADLNGNMDILDNAVNSKVDKVTGKQLSTNDYTVAEKTKLAGIAAGANNYLHPNHTGDVISTGDGVTAIAAGVIVNADVNAAAGIDASKIGTGVVSNAEFGYLDGVTSGIQGQLNGKAPLVTTPQQTTADITYYVRTDGNDNNTGLVNTAGGAFRTIQKAISVIPQMVNHVVNVYVGAGTYAESISLSGYSGKGSLYVVGVSAATTFVQSVALTGSSIIVTVDSFTCTTTTMAPISITSSIGAVMNQVISTANAPTQTGISLNLSKSRLTACVISNKMRVIDAVNAAECYAENFTGTGNGTNYYAELGAQINWAGTQASSTAGNASASGGVIVGGEGVLNPWGDNTTAIRSRCEAVANSSQAITGSTFTKILFGREDYDVFNEYDASLSRFTAKVSGVYLVTVTIPLSALPAQARTLMDLRRNGVVVWRFQDSTSSVLSDASLSGTTTMYLSAGDYLDIQVYIGGYNINTVAGGSFCVTRIA